RRIQKVSATGTTYFLHDGVDVIRELDAGGVSIAKYVHTKGIDQPLAINRGGAISFYEQSANGSVTSLTSSSGTISDTYEYGSFGNLTTSSGSTTSLLQYTGRELDVETGLYYYRARYYSATSGRFISEDPLRFGSGNVSFYPYADNNPINLIDPYGL